jgi:hypothetical protein
MDKKNVQKPKTKILFGTKFHEFLINKKYNKFPKQLKEMEFE